MQRLSHPLLLILVAFTVLCAVYIWAIPPLEGSDEFEHFAYVSWLIDEGSFPIQGEAAWSTPVRQESGQSPLYYTLASLPARLAGDSPAVVYRPNPHYRYDLDPTLPDNRNTALHYPQDRGGRWAGLHLARLVSVASGLLLIVCVYGLARATMPGRELFAVAAAAFVAAMPQVIFHSSHVSNDILAAALSTLTLWLMARLLHRGITFWRAAAVGVALGLAALTKVNTLVVALPVGLAVLWLLWQERPRRGEARGRANFWPDLLAAAAGLGGGFMLTAGWWFWRSQKLYGSFMGLDTHCYQELATCGPYRLAWPNWLLWRDTFRSFWAAFGLANIRPWDWVYWLFGLLMLAAAIGLGIATARYFSNRNTKTSAQRTSSRQTAVLLALLGLAVGASVVVLNFWMQQILATYGRLLFPTLGAFVVLLVYGLWSLNQRLARLAWLLPAVVAIAAPFWLIRPAFAAPDFQASPPPQSLGWQFGDHAELITIEPQTRSVSAGGVLPVEMCWRATTTADKNYTVFLHLVGPDNIVVADRYTYPGLGTYPTSIWEPGRTFCDTVTVPIPEDLPLTLVYQLSTGWLDDETGQRLPGFDAGGNPLPPFAGPIRLVSGRETAVAAVPEGDVAIRLAEHETAAVWCQGQANELTLHWFAAEPVATDYTVFLHLRDTEGQLMAQADGPPLEGWYPASWWEAGENVTDQHQFPVSDELPAGSYQLVAGLYDPASGNRLGEEYDLGMIDLQACEDGS